MSVTFTPDPMSSTQYTKLFTAADKDEDGILTKEEAAKALQKSVKDKAAKKREAIEDLKSLGIDPQTAILLSVLGGDDFDLSSLFDDEDDDAADKDQTAINFYSAIAGVGTVDGADADSDPDALADVIGDNDGDLTLAELTALAGGDGKLAKSELFSAATVQLVDDEDVDIGDSAIKTAINDIAGDDDDGIDIKAIFKAILKGENPINLLVQNLLPDDNPLGDLLPLLLGSGGGLGGGGLSSILPLLLLNNDDSSSDNSTLLLVLLLSQQQQPPQPSFGGFPGGFPGGGFPGGGFFG